MRDFVHQPSTERNSGVGRLLIFLFFVAGSALAQWILPETTVLDGVFSVTFLCTVVFGAVLVLSTSILGIAFLPMCAFAFGALVGRCSDQMITEILAGTGLDVKRLLISLVTVPVFFAISVQGMSTSEMLGSILDKSCSSARAEYNREYIPITVAALTGMLAVYLISGSPLL